MSVAIDNVDRSYVRDLIYSHAQFTLAESMSIDHCVQRSIAVWAGFSDGDFVCAWGLIASTLLSEQAYLWLHTTEALRGNEFAFVRHSQRMVEEMLKDWPSIAGHCQINNDRAIRWVKWLGATFGEVEDKVVPFMIRKR